VVTDASARKRGKDRMLTVSGVLQVSVLQLSQVAKSGAGLPFLHQTVEIK